MRRMRPVRRIRRILWICRIRWTNSLLSAGHSLYTVTVHSHCTQAEIGNETRDGFCFSLASNLSISSVRWCNQDIGSTTRDFRIRDTVSDTVSMHIYVWLKVTGTVTVTVMALVACLAGCSQGAARKEKRSSVGPGYQY